MTRELTSRDIDALLKAAGVDLWGAASNDPSLPMAPDLATAISLLVRFEPAELAGVESGPTPTYYEGYRRVNATLDAAASALVDALVAAGRDAERVMSTVPEDQDDAIEDWCNVPVFPHKTAATRAGLGWIGKTALFVSPVLGPRLRLATVFTDLVLPVGTPVETGRCGSCRLCVDACPAGAGVDTTWRAGLPRDELYDARACEQETNKYEDLGGVCGVCIAVCPWGRKGAVARDSA
jgi:epoxyqueuosine reductase QueG